MLSKNLSFYLLILLTASMLILSIGCAERERKETGASGSNPEADAALAKAEEAMENAGIGISFEKLQGLETLSDLTTILPDPLDLELLEDPLELEQLERSIEDATLSMYDALDALGAGVSGTPAAPMQAIEQIGSDTDLAMIHLHLAYLYIYDVLVRLVKVRKDPVTGEKMYTISFPSEEELDIENIEKIYQFEFTDELEQNLKTQGAAAFTIAQRQEIINALYLLLGAKAKLTVDGITQTLDKPRCGDVFPDCGVDTDIFPKNALYHFTEALNYVKNLAPEIEEGLKDFSEIISEEGSFAYQMLDQAEVEWGFEILNREEVENAIKELANLSSDE